MLNMRFIAVLTLFIPAFVHSTELDVDQLYDSFKQEWSADVDAPPISSHASIVLYKLTNIGFGPGIVHAAFRFRRSKGEPLEFDIGWGRNGIYARVEDRDPIRSIEITSNYAETVLGFVLSSNWRGKTYDMLEENCTDFVYDVLCQIAKGMEVEQVGKGKDSFAKELGMFIID